MPDERYVMGIFPDESRAVSVVKAMADTQWKVHKVHSPFPSHEIWEALGTKESKVPYFTLIGGIIGFLSGFSLAIFTATRWDLIVGGKPIVALVPFFIVGFEFTILFAVFGNVIGLLWNTRLPKFKAQKYYDPKCSGSHFGILAACEDGNVDGLKSFFTNKGGEVRVFDD